MIVGAIANEMGISGQDIGHIRIHDSYSTVALPTGMTPPEQKKLQTIWVAQRQLDAQKLDGAPVEEPGFGGGRSGGRKPPYKGKQRGGYGGVKLRQSRWRLQTSRPVLNPDRSTANFSAQPTHLAGLNALSPSEITPTQSD